MWQEDEGTEVSTRDLRRSTRGSQSWRKVRGSESNLGILLLPTLAADLQLRCPSSIRAAHGIGAGLTLSVGNPWDGRGTRMEIGFGTPLLPAPPASLLTISPTRGRGSWPYYSARDEIRRVLLDAESRCSSSHASSTGVGESFRRALGVSSTPWPLGELRTHELLEGIGLSFLPSI